MGLSIQNEAVETLARDLARRHGKGVTKIIQLALVEKAQHDGPEMTLWEAACAVGRLHRVTRERASDW